MKKLIQRYIFKLNKIIILFLILTSLLNAQKSQLIIKDIDAPSMSNNLLGIPTSQKVAIYLPAGYDTSNISYPVVYFLPGYGDQVQFWTNGNYQGFKLQEAMDRLIAAGKLHKFIVVIPNGYNFLGGSFYVNSPVTGNCEDFLAKDVVGYIDSNYRTIKNPASRGISGHSMGGFGALNLAMRHPDIFGMVYSLSPGLFAANGLSKCQLFKNQAFINQFIQKEQEFAGMSDSAALSALKSYIQGRFSSGDWDTPFAFAYGAAFSPDADKNIPYIDYPYSKSDDKLILDSAKLLNYENGYGGFSGKVTANIDNLKKLKYIAVDYGLNDYYQWIPAGCEYFSGLLTSAGIQHEMVTFNGGHEEQVRKRIEEFLLPFFSERLTFDTSLTGIKLNSILPEDFELFQNYPNPFNPETTISFRIPKESTISLKVYNSLGEQVKTLIDDKLTAGTYKVKFDGSSLASGIYLCSLNVPDQKIYNKALKLVLIK